MEKLTQNLKIFRKVWKVNHLWRKFQTAITCVSSIMHKIELIKWDALIDSRNSKDLCDSIVWTFRLSNDELPLHFEKLYSSDHPQQLAKVFQWIFMTRFMMIKLRKLKWTMQRKCKIAGLITTLAYWSYYTCIMSSLLHLLLHHVLHIILCLVS